ncbi:MAG: GTP cyclohydrolase I FolE [Bdellovibrionales bacterium CG10_big_fil_rev_8_21_14_0_10_45_34]|nr:MAG: GTP cyclohydrolase I FolE [Bdellovibrionales bacterium CG10_big_fil_rev_8_21_14_0_10_45_34]
MSQASQDFDEDRVVKELKFSPESVLEHVRPHPVLSNKLTSEQKIEKIAKSFAEILETLGLDLNNESIKKTPQRVAKMYVNEVFAGLKSDAFPKITVIENEMAYDQMVLIDNISILSCCEHHFATIDGKARVAYIPNKRVIGLSKINRIADFFSRRPQVQERLTKQIADSLCYILDTKDVAVSITAKHYCVASRGVQDEASLTTTCDLRGSFKHDARTRSEFVSHGSK